ncbi:MAG: YHYH protein [Blastocatellia bacterium]
MKKTMMILFLALAAMPVFCQPQQGDGIWLRNAAYGEFQTFDGCNGHQPGNGQYHHHINPICLRAQLGDNLVAASTGRTGTVYREKAALWTHSPILGWALDGHPIYGPYGYSDPNNAASAVKRLKSGFRLRNITSRATLPDWALAFHTNVAQTLTASQQGPVVSATFPLGRYLEDYEYAQGLGDLDVYNGRFEITPEYPNGTYAYHITLNDDGTPAFPYILGMQYYGEVTGNANATVPAGVQDFFTSGAPPSNTSSAALLSSWTTRNAQQNALVISGYNPAGGPKTTWPTDAPAGARVNGGQTTPALADVQRIRYSDTAVYVNSNGLPSYVIGPWFGEAMPGGVFDNWPSSRAYSLQLPRTPAAAATRRNTGLGPVGMWVNGVPVFNMLDGASYTNASGNDTGGGLVRPGSLHVSAASFEGGPTAPGAMMTAFSLFGAQLAGSAASAATPAWPTSLGGTTVTIVDAAGSSHQAAIGFASAAQVNYRVPENAATGFATVTVSAAGQQAVGRINIAPAYENLFSFNNDGLVAGYIVRVRNGQQTFESIFQVSAANEVIAAPIDVGNAGDEVYLALFGTGLGKNNPVVTATIGGASATVAYAGAQGTWAGLDQFNVRIPTSLAGRNKVDVILTVDGKVSNTRNISIR